MSISPYTDELVRITELWHAERKRLCELKILLLSQGKTVQEIRKNREYRSVRKKIKSLSVSRRHYNAKQSRFVERKSRHE